MNIEKTEIEEIRSPQELIDWIDQLDEKVCRLLLKDRQALRVSKDRNWKVVNEEIHILYHWVKKSKPSELIRVQLIVGNQSYDAIVTDEHGNKQKIEITYPKDGYREHKINLQLNEYGHASAWCKPNVIGSKNKGFKIAPPNLLCLRGDEICDQQLAEIEKSLIKKLKKGYDDVTLLVAYSGLRVVFVDGQEAKFISFVNNVLKDNPVNGVNKIVFVDIHDINQLVEFNVKETCFQ